MASSNDFEKIWESYQEVVKTKDISIVDYCQRNGIVYSQFQRWYKKHISGVNIVPVSAPDFQTDSAMISEESNPSQHLSGHAKAKVNYVNIVQRIEGMPEIHKLRAFEDAGRETGGLMLAITGATRLYYVAGFTDMRYGKYALANVVRYQLHRNPYNGDGYMFMSKDRQKMKILVYSHNLYRLYDLSYDKGLSFMKIENEDGTPVTGSKPIEWKYLVALLNCPVRKKLVINSN